MCTMKQLSANVKVEGEDALVTSEERRSEIRTAQNWKLVCNAPCFHELKLMTDLVNHWER